jgi:hypothetical protein
MLAALALAFSPACGLYADDTGVYYRDYSLAFGLPWDLSGATQNGRGVAKALSDIYYRGLSSGIESDFIRGTIGALWSFAVSWSSTMWPHELGHYLRAEQHGAVFRIERLAFPGAIGSVRFPPGAEIDDELAFVIGGLEVNAAIARDIQRDWYYRGGLYNDELYNAFFQRMMAPAYAWLFIPVDPADPASWKDGGGKPRAIGDFASVARLIYEKTGGLLMLDEDTVDPAFVELYKKMKLWSLLWNLADFNTYHQLRALFRGELDGSPAPYLIGGPEGGWSYGTAFNLSPLGAELYLYNYVALRDGFLSGYLRYGVPMQNYGVGLDLPALLRSRRLELDVELHLWHQDTYGLGFGVGMDLSMPLPRRISLSYRFLFKEGGYLLGAPLQAGVSGGLCLRFAR